MRVTFPTIAIAAATFAATLAFAPALVRIGQSLDLDLGQFLTAPEKAPVSATTQKPVCGSPLATLVDALGDKDCG